MTFHASSLKKYIPAFSWRVILFVSPWLCASGWSDCCILLYSFCWPISVSCPLDRGLHRPLVPAFKICWQKIWFTFPFHKWWMWMKSWTWSNDRRTRPFLYPPEDVPHLDESYYAVLSGACVEISVRMVESSLGKLKLYVGWVEFLVREKYAHLKYLEWEWVGRSPQKGEMEACVTAMAWNSLFCILWILPCLQFVGWIVFLLLHLFHFIWVAQ